MQAHRYIRTIDTVVDAIQFRDAASAHAIVEWIGLCGKGHHLALRFDAVDNVVYIPALTRPTRVELGWWVMRWPSGDFSAHPPADVATMVDPPVGFRHRQESDTEVPRGVLHGAGVADLATTRGDGPPLALGR